MLLKKLNLPNDIHNLSLDELTELAREVRERIIEVSLQNGGHIGASLGAVELIVSLLNVFDANKDKIIFDVGHQAYAYKILTGRNEDFDKLRIMGGISGFPKPSESQYDYFVGGHAGNAISAGCGYAMAEQLNKSGAQVISIVGDGVMVNGETGEGLNLAAITGKQIIIINDNTFSISASVGSVPNYLEKLRGNKFNGKIIEGENSPFNYYDLGYIGAVNGHEIPELISVFELAKKSEKSVIIHVVTNKGKGYAPAEQNPLKMHGISPKGEITGVSFGAVLGASLLKLREKNDKVVAVAAAMASSTGLSVFAEKYPESFIDVGIAESTAVTVAAALARAGFKPYVAIYSTFLQRAYDQILYDVALDDLDVTFCIDRAGIVGEDGESHQGIYDLALLNSVPNMKILAPASAQELQEMLTWSAKNSGVKAIRYPRGNADTSFATNGDYLHWQVLKEDANAYILAVGARMLETGKNVIAELNRKNKSIGLVNARAIKPFDETFLSAHRDCKFFVIEDSIYQGSLSQILIGKGYKITPFTLPNTYVVLGKVAQLQEKYGIDVLTIANKIDKAL